jgi:SAM-dependent methyltransferase
MNLTSRLVMEDRPRNRPFELFLERTNSLPGPRILEIGGRNVTGSSWREKFPGCREYVGLDVHAGENVDVVGDAHRLSELFPPGHFDAVFSIAVFEHLAMPWKVVLEANKVLKDGGLFFTWTVPNWPGHAQPWDFWRFTKEAFRVLLNERTGFSIIAAEEMAPGALFPLVRWNVLDRTFYDPANMIVCVLARKTAPPDGRLSWDVAVDDVLDGTYPVPKARDGLFPGSVQGS